MKVCVIGTGYVGLVTGTCLAETGNEVICVDKDNNKLSKLKDGIIPIYEHGLEELIKNNIKEQRLFFSNDLKNSVEQSDIIFIAVGTPENNDGTCNLDYVYEVANQISVAMNSYKVVVNKSTAPIGTAYKIKNIISEKTKFSFDIVSNPEFLKQGTAVEDFLSPDRIVIGAESKKAIEIMQDLYSPFFRTGNRFVIMDIKSAEMTKYASNCFLATKISFINELSILCEKLGANIENVRIGMSTDTRIGNKFLFPGVGYGGSCFPKDTKALINIAKENSIKLNLIEATDTVNENQKNYFLNKIYKRFNNNLKDIKLAVWGLSFKPKTNDIRNAPSIAIINELLKKGAKISVFDPKAIEETKLIFKDNISYAKNSYDALDNCDALILLTEWNEFRRPDFDLIKTKLKAPVIFDARNQYINYNLKEKNIDYYCIGIN